MDTTAIVDPAKRPVKLQTAYPGSSYRASVHDSEAEWRRWQHFRWSPDAAAVAPRGVRRSGSGEEPALGGVAAECAEPLELRGSFDVFGGYVEVHRVRQADQCGHDLLCGGVGAVDFTQADGYGAEFRTSFTPAAGHRATAGTPAQLTAHGA
jgi:hypothetical protein